VLKLPRPAAVSDAIDIGGVRHIPPSRLELHAVSGGFNTVVEFSAGACLKRFRRETPSSDDVVPLLEAELQTLASNAPASTIVDELLDIVP
ncbi:hypothetical protein, partial [Acinetobacter baumannii]|uniref:hypothetical protein n=1 Tax=Acinetobacter baumannii TaxID=470 RepID=UPI00286F9BFF